MLLEKIIQITVFQVDNTTFEAIGDISQFTSLIWPDSFNGYANFEMWAPITDDNAALLKEGNILWTGGENAAVIEIVKSSIDENGEKTFNIKGRTLEKLLEDRILWGGYSFTNKYASTIMYSLVNVCCINPTNASRKIPWLVNATDAQVGNKIDTYQKTGGWVYDALYNLAADSDIGFSVLFDPRNKQLVFQVRAGVDHTQGNAEGNDPVVFSTELEDILSSVYYSNAEDIKNVALVQGEESGTARKSVITGNNALTGYNRKELYVDARDLQSEVYNEDGTSTKLTDVQYLATLTQRGNEKLAECDLVETFEAKVRQFGDIQYEFGVDYQKGDKITVVDEQLGITVSARITKVEEDFDDEYELVLTFGYAYPTVMQKLKRATT